MKICIECRWHKKQYGGQLCLYSRARHVVSGASTTCLSQREKVSDGFWECCGPKGDWFEAKEEK